MEDLQRLSSDLASAFERVRTSVFRVRASGGEAATGVHWRQGLVVTTDRAVRGASAILARRSDGETVAATVARRDPSLDLALLRLDGTGIPVAETATDAEVKVGQVVLAVAAGARASCGIVSFTGSLGSGGATLDIVGVDARVYDGFAGAALADAGGRAIGIVTSRVSRQVPIAMRAGVVDRWVDGALTRRRAAVAYLGVHTQPVEVPEAYRDRLPSGQRNAVLVVSTEPEGPAAAAGLLPGDMIVAMSGRPITDRATLRAAVEFERPGTLVSMSVLRAGERREVQIVLGTHPRGG